MGLEEDQKKREDEEKQEEKNEDESNSPADPLSNVDLILPPCEVETLLAKKALLPQETKIPSIHSIISPEQMEMTGLRVKIACLEKTNVALKLELKSAELRVAAKEKLDKQKTRLLELLDLKVADLETKNKSLIEMVESLLTDKKARNARMIDASNSMELMAIKLEESDKVKRELKANNNELKKMLNDIETKGSQVAKIAKEKLVKFKDENTRMQGELDEYKQREEKSSGEIDLSWKQLNKLGLELQSQVSAAKLAETPESTNETLTCIDELNKQIIAMMEQMQADTNSTIQKFSASYEKLASHISELKRNIGELESMSEKTLSQASPTLLQLSDLRGAIESLVKLGGILVV